MMWRHRVGGYPMHDQYGAWWFLALLVVILLALALGVLISLALRLERPAAMASAVASKQQEEQEILRRRYAAGEIDDQELAHRLATLRDHPH